MNPLFVKTLRAVVRRFAPKFLSVAYANRHLVVSCWPARRRFALTPGSLRPLLRELGFGAPFFAALPMAALQVIWHGPDGLFSFRSEHPRSLQRGRIRRMETIPARQPLICLLFESLEAELAPAFLHNLGHLVGAPVVFNAGDAYQEWLERTPAYRWQGGRRSAVVAFGADVTPALFWEGEQAQEKPPGPWLVSSFGPPVSDCPALMRRISQDLQSAAAWPPSGQKGRGWSLAEFGRLVQAQPALKEVLKIQGSPGRNNQPDPAALAALAQLLGGGVRYTPVWAEQLKVALEPAWVFPRPMALAGFDSLAAAGLPPEMPVVGEDGASPLLERQPVRVETSGGWLKYAKGIRLVDDIRAGELRLPWLAALTPRPLVQQSGARQEEVTTEEPLFLVNGHRRRTRTLWRLLSAAPDALRLAAIAHLATSDERGRAGVLQHLVSESMSLFDWPALAAYLLERPTVKETGVLHEVQTRLGRYPAVVDHTLERVNERIQDEDLRAGLARLLNTFRERRETTLRELKGAL
jgi:hypothetical protein